MNKAGFPWVKRRARNQQESSYPQLLSLLGQDGCPVCQTLQPHDRRYFFWFLHENYQELEVINDLTRSLGFCLSHGDVLTDGVEGRSALGLAHAHVVRRIREQLDGAGASDGKKDGALATLAAPAPCPACHAHQTQAEATTFFLAAVLERPEGLQRYGHPGLLCHPHLQAILPRVPPPVFRRLLAVYEQTLTDAWEGYQASPSSAASRRLLGLVVGHDSGEGPYPDVPLGPPQDPGLDAVGLMAERMRGADTCPICLEQRRSWIEWIGQINTLAQQEQAIEDLLPTCPQHAWAVMHAGSPELQTITAVHVLGVMRGLLSTALQALNARTPTRRGGALRSGIAAWLQARRGERTAREILARGMYCPVCARMETAQERALELLFALVKEPRHRQDFQNGYGLCLHHFSRALRLTQDKEQRAALSTVEYAKLSRLEWELEEYARKTAWSSRPEAKGGEQSAPFRAVWRCSGSLKWGRS